MTHPGGRPPIFSDPEVLQEQVDQYFIHCDETLIDKPIIRKGETFLQQVTTPYTMAGLALWLGMSRDALNRYRHDDKFCDVLTQARNKVESNNVTMGLLGIYEPKLNALNLASNFGYATRSEVHNENEEVDTSTKDDQDELKRIAKEIAQLRVIQGGKG